MGSHYVYVCGEEFWISWVCFCVSVLTHVLFLVLERLCLFVSLFTCLRVFYDVQLFGPKRQAQKGAGK